MLASPAYANQHLLHRTIIRPAAAFGADPSDVLGWVFNVAGFAMYAVGGVDLQLGLAAFFYDFIHAGGAVAGFRAGVFALVHRNHGGRVAQGEVAGLVFFVAEVGKEHAAQAVEGEFAVGFRVLDGAAGCGFAGGGVVAVAVF